METLTRLPPYLTLAETAALLRVSPKRLQNLMGNKGGVLVENVHYFRPRKGRPRFSRDAMIAYIEGRDSELMGPARRRAAR